MKTEYQIEVEPGTGFARLLVDGVLWARLWLGAKVDTTAGADELARRSVPVVTEDSDGRRIVVEAQSSVWRQERFILECHEDHAEAWVEVEGQGDITSLWLLGSNLSDPLVTARLYSQAAFRSVYSPAPAQSGRWVRGAGESTALSVGGTYLPGHSDWYFTPPPFCFAMSMAEAPGAVLTEPGGPWMGASLVAAAGEHNFTDYEYFGHDGSFCLGLQYGGQVRVTEKFVSPKIILTFGHATPGDALRDYARRYGEQTRTTEKLDIPDWWSAPMFCGWGAQVVLAEELGVPAPAAATRMSYDSFLSAMNARDIVPATVVIDDKWQQYYGTNVVDPVKWPQLRQWIRARQASSQKVLLWLKLWDPEGLLADECVVNHLGVPVAADPTNPKYERRLRRMVRRMLGADGYGADGFKLDFSGRIPMSGSLERHGQEWGVELQHKLLEIIYSEAKQVRPDALVIGHVPHPYFADVLDMIRLNDVTPGLPVVRQMQQRAAIVQAVCPELLIDADNWQMPNIDEWRQYMAVSAEMGVPALYYATGVSLSEPFEPEDYELIAKAWQRRGEQTA